MSPTFILRENLGAVHSANNPSSAGCSKHLEIRFLKIREYQEQHRLIVKHIDGVANAADIFTKPLAKDIFDKYLVKLGMKLSKTQPCPPQP